VQDGATGYTIPDSDPEALCNKLSGLLGDAHLRETMGLHAAEYALDYAWANIAAQIVDVYKGLVEKRSVGLLFTDGSRVARS
jgi:glycosyltransferase involved in cell wall biosynthesis